MKLVEGESYQFKIVKITYVLDEGEFFVLEHTSGRRLLLPCKYYEKYGFSIGQKIKCRVDKISCTGKVYLEPEHPYYIENHVYEFKVLGFEDNHNYEGIKAIIVKDCFENVIKYFSKESCNLIENETIKLVVERIKKGIPVLHIPSSEITKSSFQVGKEEYSSFTVIRIETGYDGEEFFVLESSEGKLAYLKVKHFKAYNIKVGNIVSCKIYGQTPIGFLKVEPKNPYYIVGNEYFFNVIKTLDPDLLSNSNDEQLIIVEDIFGTKCGVSVPNQMYTTIKDKTQLKCWVIGFRKGRPKLKFSLNNK